MNRSIPTAAFLSCFALVAFALAPAAVIARSPETDRWIHVAVDGSGEEGERVRVNLPVKLVSALEPILSKHGIDNESIFHLNGRELTREDLVEILQAVKAAKDGELISVDDADDHVRITKEKGFMLIHVTEHAKGGDKVKKGRDAEPTETVDVKIPIPVLEALLSGPKDELDLGAALAALSSIDSNELVSVKDGDEIVRIWIDDKNASD